jgi:hypothetical protein
MDRAMVGPALSCSLRRAWNGHRPGAPSEVCASPKVYFVPPLMRARIRQRLFRFAAIMNLQI